MFFHFRSDKVRLAHFRSGYMLIQIRSPYVMICEIRLVKIG
jgi:hypothetical protein